MKTNKAHEIDHKAQNITQQTKNIQIRLGLE